MLFDDDSARRFIGENLYPQHLIAFDRCTHPAMRADYFRLCFILRLGGVYVDADDEYQGADLEPLVGKGHLRLQALCYDIPSDSMVDVALAVQDDPVVDRIFYVNNNPLIGRPGHPVIAAALERATEALAHRIGATRDIQSLTGPGNLTAALVRHAAEQDAAGQAYDFEVLTTWDEVAISKWPLAYRDDERNWRHWARGAAVPPASKAGGS
jgi:mannosyltransferase OCH1-like enzyme